MYTKLFTNESRTIVISGPHIQVADTSTGQIIHSTTQRTLEDLERDSVLKSGPIRCAAVDSAFKYLAEVGEDKMLKVWEVEGLKLQSARELPKKPTSILFTADSQTILVSDKFGDVFSYSLEYVPLTKAQKKDALSSHENPSGGTLVLGHASPLNAFLLTPPDKEDYIITADRDEHIRVSWYPQGYSIEMYCLGHLKFVSALHIPPSQPSTLISGGGDPILKVWTWMTGDEIIDIPIWEEVESFIVVKKSRRPDCGDGDGEDEGDGEGKGTRAKRRKGKGKGKKKELKEQDEAMEAPQQGGEEGEGSQVAKEEPEPEKILAIRKIGSVNTDGGLHVVFSAIGATALFSFSFAAPSPTIHHLDFGKPVIDFVVSESGIVWVLLDVEWPSGWKAEGAERIKLAEVSTSGELLELSPDARRPYSNLLTTLNKNAVVPASQTDLKTLDLYAELLTLPKFVNPATASHPNPDAEPNSEFNETGTPASENVGGNGPGNALTKKELGRLKRTKKVEEVKQKVGGGLLGSAGDSGEVNQNGGGSQLEAEGAGNTEEPETKRAKSDGDGDGDVIMS